MYSASIKNSVFEVEKSETHFLVNGNILEWTISKVRDRHFLVIYKEQSYKLEVVEVDSAIKQVKLKLNNRPCTILLKDRFDLLLEKLGMNNLQQNRAKDIKAPMPGLIFDIQVKEGQEVKKGEPVLILEAMKMENIIKSPGEGIVKHIKVNKGDSVEKNQVLIQF
ncbi:acetyl-CoA carboxylase biotin carboxyl carrier protein subunit [Cecembia sp.]|uniref:acetyl-CoA carboxylase biotin carboxyl carrier protein subunit n=1 Tax=Cecembia sp. TaxID=1898110 RepID=UPI0025C291FE|nr:acetyl-CoA carboxylase biotin carboxyl carrier protein subunit [Cecembia sp.]